MENCGNRKNTLIEDVIEAATITGISARSIYRMKNEFKSGNLSTPGKERKRTENDRRQSKIDDSIFSAIRRCILSFSKIRNLALTSSDK